MLAGHANVQALRTFADASRLRAALEAGARLTVIGGGLIGLEVASSARRLGAAVTVVEAASAPASPARARGGRAAGGATPGGGGGTCASAPR